ncbi:MAG TPA: MaoC family dehydratase N-terminal domain-containing protein [Mycobacterium sp.]|nr:MaoC family dehydratase N-terminal domain-containing protein [Mycobacterium sp.]
MNTEDEPADLATFIGMTLRSNIISQDCVNVAMIRHWVEAMGDDNPVYLDRRAAEATGRSDIVAPATMVQAWTMVGYRATVSPDAERPDLAGARALGQCLAAHGYTAVVATNSEFEFFEELSPGDRIRLDEVVEDISSERRTRLGVGRFVTSLKIYRDQEGNVVAQQHWRTLRYKPADQDAG